MKNMTAGSIPKHLLGYSVPLILGNLFQLTYNAVDSIVLGRFASTESLAAVGTANPVMNIIIFFISGICLGASVLMSEFYGAGNRDRLKLEVSTTFIFGFFFTIIISIAGILLAKPLLLAINVPAKLINKSALYLCIIFSGLIFTFLYNGASASLKSIGNSRTPILFLAMACILNIVLDLLFVAVLKADVFGAAVATVISQAFSAALCILYIYRKEPLLRLARKDWRVDSGLLKKTIHYGWVTAMQQSCLHIGKLLVQGAVNPLGVDVIAAFNAVNRIDDFAFTPEQSISHGMTTFTAQNRGAGNHKRILKGFRIGLLLEFLYWLLICTVILIFARPIMGLFAKEGEFQIIVLGTSYLHLMAFFYLLPGQTNGIQGFFRGMGNMRITLISTTIQMVFRVLFAYLLIPSMGMQGIAYACLAGWIAMLLAEVPYYIYYKKCIWKPACS